MHALWARIAPGHQDDPEPWFGRLCRDHGPDVALTALSQFADAGRRLEDLERPSSYPAYFRACCTRLAREGIQPGQPRSQRHAHRPGSTTYRSAPGAASAYTAGPADYRQDLRALYLADRQPESDPHPFAGVRGHSIPPAPPSGHGLHRRQTRLASAREAPVVQPGPRTPGHPSRRAQPA